VKAGQPAISLFTLPSSPFDLRHLLPFDDQIGEIDVAARLARFGILALCALFGFQLLALALGLLALTLDDGNLWPVVDRKIGYLDLDCDDVRCLQTFRSFDDIELNRGAFGKRPEAGALNR
jgi:hypothetical protein